MDRIQESQETLPTINLENAPTTIRLIDTEGNDLAKLNYDNVALPTPQNVLWADKALSAMHAGMQEVKKRVGFNPLAAFTTKYDLVLAHPELMGSDQEGITHAAVAYLENNSGHMEPVIIFNSSSYGVDESLSGYLLGHELTGFLDVPASHWEGTPKKIDYSDMKMLKHSANNLLKYAHMLDNLDAHHAGDKTTILDYTMSRLGVDADALVREPSLMRYIQKETLQDLAGIVLSGKQPHFNATDNPENPPVHAPLATKYVKGALLLEAWYRAALTKNPNNDALKKEYEKFNVEIYSPSGGMTKAENDEIRRNLESATLHPGSVAPEKIAEIRSRITGLLANYEKRLQDKIHPKPGPSIP